MKYLKNFKNILFVFLSIFFIYTTVTCPIFLTKKKSLEILEIYDVRYDINNFAKTFDVVLQPENTVGDYLIDPKLLQALNKLNTHDYGYYIIIKNK